MRPHTMFRRAFLSTGVAVGVLLLCSTMQAKTLFTFGTRLEVTQIRAKRDPKPGIEKKLRRTSVIRKLRRKFKTRYKSYRLVSSEHLQAQIGENHEFELDNGKVLDLKVLGYKADPKTVNLKVQIEYSISLPIVKSGRHWVRVIDKGDEDLILIITPTLLQIRKP